jgi:hypothetical protein
MMKMEDHKVKKPSGPGYETRDANVRVFAGVGIAFVLLLIFTLIVLDQIFDVSREKVVEDVVMSPPSTPLQEMRNREDEVLNSYKVIDAQKGIYQIPIRRAMEILANRAYQQRQKSEGNRNVP